jgi:hypothetical protein
MKYVMIAGEYLVGAVILLMSLVTIAFGLVLSLFDLPRYLHNMKR